MEYEEEYYDVPRDVPEFGAIFMSNIATKKECFKRKIFGLPSFQANFVKQVKAGMVLFLFEFEKRQLFGVYRASSDGALNIVPHAFSSSGKEFPAQVRFSPIWLCSPLSENEFRGAISNNYYSAKKFKFGLSEDQVRHLLQLFSMRKLNDRLPPRQLTRPVSGFMSKGGREVDQARFPIREGLEMEDSNEDYCPSVVRNLLVNSEDRGFEADYDKLFIGDRLDIGKSVDSFGQDFLTDQAGDSLHKRRRLYRLYNDVSVAESYKTCNPQLSFKTDNLESFMEKERISATPSWFLRGENGNDGNIYNSPASTTIYPGGTCDLTKRADYGRPFNNGKNGFAAEDDRFLRNDIMKTKLGLNNSLRPAIAYEHESGLLGRAEKTTDNLEILMNNGLGHKNHMETGVMPVFPSENFENPLHRMTVGERVTSTLDLDNGDERRFPDKGRFAKANYLDGLHSSATLNMSSGYKMSIGRQEVDDCGFSKTSSVDNGQDIATRRRPIISTDCNTFNQPRQSSLECFNKHLPDIQFSNYRESQNFKASSSSSHDAIITSAVPYVPELPSRHHPVYSLSTAAVHSASLARDTTLYHSGGDFLTLSKSKFVEPEGSTRHNPSDFGNKVSFPASHDHYPRMVEVSDSMDLKYTASADYRCFQCSPSNLGSVPLEESLDFISRKNSLAFDGRPSVMLPGMKKYILHQTNNDIYAGSEPLTSNANLTDLDICHEEKDPINYGSECHKNVHSRHFITPESAYSDPEKQRKSVFTRLSSRPRLVAKQEEKGGDLCIDTSVDEVMEMLHQNQRLPMKSLKKTKRVIKQHDEVEMSMNGTRVSFENHIDQGRSKYMPVKIIKEANQATEDSVDEMPEETRVVEFRRRRVFKKSLDDNNATSEVVRIEDCISGKNAAREGQPDKQQKRRKLVRPVFGNGVLVDGTDDNRNSLSLC